MSPKKDELHARLGRDQEINISVTGRKSGRTISNPVWFIFDKNELFLLPVQGSDTQWYKNVLENPTMRIDPRVEEVEGRAVPISDTKQVSSVIVKFREKYGVGYEKKYYSKFDVAVRVEMR